jgi:hypothetical protein
VATSWRGGSFYGECGSANDNNDNNRFQLITGVTAAHLVATAGTCLSRELKLTNVTVSAFQPVVDWARRGYLIQRSNRVRNGTARVLSDSWAAHMLSVAHKNYVEKLIPEFGV